MTDINTEYKLKKEKLLTNMDKNCQQFFASKYSLEYAYCLLLQDRLEEAKRELSGIIESDIRAHWLDFLISLIEVDANGYPSYFELRNFLEIDLNILLHYFKGDYVENILRYSDSMFAINPEVYKFLGRVLYNNGYEPQAMYFLDKAKSYFYNDPELHYLLAFIYYNKGDYVKVREAIDNCLKILPEYFPALNMKRKIKSFS